MLFCASEIRASCECIRNVQYDIKWSCLCALITGYHIITHANLGAWISTVVVRRSPLTRRAINPGVCRLL